MAIDEKFNPPNGENVQKGDKLIQIVGKHISVFPVQRVEENKLYYGNSPYHSQKYEDSIIKTQSGKFLVGDNMRCIFISKEPHIKTALALTNGKKPRVKLYPSF